MLSPKRGRGGLQKGEDFLLLKIFFPPTAIEGGRGREGERERERERETERERERERERDKEEKSLKQHREKKRE